MLGCGPNTTLSLDESLPLDMRHDNGGWLMWVCLIKSQDGTSRVPNPVGGIDHVLLCLLVVAVDVLVMALHVKTQHKTHH